MTPSTRLHRFGDRAARYRGVAACVAAAMMLAPAQLAAQDAPPTNESERPPPRVPTDVDPEARRLAERGLAHYEAGRYAEAIADLEASYDITAAPGLLYNLAQAYRLKGDCGRALDLYRRFLAEGPVGNIRELTEGRIAETERCLAGAPPKHRPPDPAVQPLPPEATPPSLRLGSEPVRTQPREEKSWRQRAGIGLGAAAVALAVTGAVFGWRAREASGDVDAVYDRGGVWGPYAMQREQDGLRDERFALALAIGALVSAGISGWLLLRR
jgi:tetratricopeptide (TPR) repeat protein